MAKITGKKLAKEAGLDVAHALYRKTGDWYHILRLFPGALLDANGYIKFETEEDYNAFIRDGATVGVHQNLDTNTLVIEGGISQHKNYQFRSGITVFPDEVSVDIPIIEGAKIQIIVNRYERDPQARKDCIKRWGTSCSVCGRNFSDEYGAVGEGFIHVHHLIPIASINAEYTLVPARDLRPVCPNCHAMLHQRRPLPFSIEELKAIRETAFKRSKSANLDAT